MIKIEHCECKCNYEGFLVNNEVFMAESLEIDENLYTFSYLITNSNATLNSIVFFIQCKESRFSVESSNTEINLIGNPNEVPIFYTECLVEPCVENSYTVEYGMQQIKIQVKSALNINEIRFVLTFTVPVGMVLTYKAGALKIKYGEEINIVNYICMPGCDDECDRRKNICEMWLVEKDILNSKKNTFIHYSENLFPNGIDLNSLSLDELEGRIRQIVKLEMSTAKLNCNVAKVLENLNENSIIK